ncbi:MAG TPA: hypothetical protein VFH02_02415 [Jiangellaceae bacterium]|nr:hypothetical protein [Jiangellaceae bacterium]
MTSTMPLSSLAEVGDVDAGVVGDQGAPGAGANRAASPHDESTASRAVEVVALAQT